MEQAERERLAAELDAEIRPLINTVSDPIDGYDCCDCSKYGSLLDHAIEIVLRAEGGK